MPALYHFTCGHGAAGIRSDNMTVRPMTGLAWFTDLDVPYREALGLTNYLTKCDRTAFTFTVTDPDGVGIVPWTSIRREHPNADLLESAPGVMPMHWFVSRIPVPVKELTG